MSTTMGSKNIGIRKSEFVAMTQFHSNYTINICIYMCANKIYKNIKVKYHF